MQAPSWQECEITLSAEHDYPNPYTEVEVWAEFSHDSGLSLIRPAFWDGKRTWKIRFASPLASGKWSWQSFSSVEDAGLAGKSGEFLSEASTNTNNRFYRHGFWRMSPGKRNVVHADGNQPWWWVTPPGRSPGEPPKRFLTRAVGHASTFVLMLDNYYNRWLSCSFLWLLWLGWCNPYERSSRSAGV